MKAKAFAPATVANVGVGFDILGFALEGLGEIATVERTPNPTVIVNAVKGFPEIPTDPEKNTAAAGLLRLIKEKKLPFGFRITLDKKIPVGSGLGGSSTSAVAALIAANSLLTKKLSADELLDYALTGEEVASQSRHADNIAPCLRGGLLLIPGHSMNTVKITTPPSLRCVLILPKISIQTKEARALLKPQISLAQFVQQSANLAGFVLGCTQKNYSLIRESLKDVIIEPQRAHLVPSFYSFQKTALSAGALGCSLSGSGPALFALAENQKSAEKILRALRQTATSEKVPLQGYWISAISKKGASLMQAKSGNKK